MTGFLADVGQRIRASWPIYVIIAITAFTLGFAQAHGWI